jgi:Ca2+-binding EF-hand superfamily protein
MDKEGYGKINLNQFVEFLQAYNITATKESIRSLFVDMNKSGDGILLGDFEKWVKGKKRHLQGYFTSIRSRKKF